MNNRVMVFFFLGALGLAVTAEVRASDYGPASRTVGFGLERYRNTTQRSIQHEREALNLERQRMHRHFDGLMRAMDQRNREVDLWQSRQRFNHQEVARIANRQREQINREREHLNRERDRLNREFDARNRALDRHHQMLSQRHHERRHYPDGRQRRW